MAKKDDVDEVEVEESEEEAAAKAVEAAARKKKLLLLAVIGVVLLLIAGGGTWFALRMLNGDKALPAEAKPEEHAAAEAGKATKDAKDSKDAKGEKPAHKEALYDVLDPPFLANYQVAGRSHYLQMSLAVMARDQAAIDAVHTHMPLLRNRIVMLLSGEVFEQLQSDEGRVQLRQKLLEAIQEILKKETGNPQIEQVFFTNFVMQ
jgi:flagellar FliL protein